MKVSRKIKGCFEGVLREFKAFFNDITVLRGQKASYIKKVTSLKRP